MSESDNPLSVSIELITQPAAEKELEAGVPKPMDPPKPGEIYALPGAITGPILLMLKQDGWKVVGSDQLGLRWMWPHDALEHRTRDAVAHSLALRVEVNVKKNIEDWALRPELWSQGWQPEGGNR